MTRMLFTDISGVSMSGSTGASGSIDTKVVKIRPKVDLTVSALYIDILGLYFREDNPYFRVKPVIYDRFKNLVFLNPTDTDILIAGVNKVSLSSTYKLLAGRDYYIGFEMRDANNIHTNANLSYANASQIGTGVGNNYFDVYVPSYFSGKDASQFPNYTSDNLMLFGLEATENTAPTTPGAFTSPVAGTVLKGGETKTVSFGASTDAEGDVLKYNLYAEYWNGNAWVGTTQLLFLSTAISVSYKLSNNSSYSKVRFLVQAYDGQYYSQQRFSPEYTLVQNTAPTLTINTTDNQTLSEREGQNELLVEGTAKDTDPNNTVTVRMQINDGTIRNIASAISDGSTEIPFSRLLTYSDQRIFDGSTPISIALSEGVDHKLKVWADDGQGGISVIAERKFQVIHNRPPVITDTDRDLGTLIESPSVTYQVNDLEGQAVTVTEKINGQVIRTFEAVANEDNTLEIPLEMWIPLQLTQHSLTVEATDSHGLKSVRTYTFTRTEDTILLELKNPFVTDIAATRILVTPEVYVPIGSTIKIEACNNAFDDAPTWEDITSMAMNKRGFSFTNTEKTADQWGINIRFTLEKGTATQEVRLDGFGGAFE